MDLQEDRHWFCTNTSVILLVHVYLNNCLQCVYPLHFLLCIIVLGVSLIIVRAVNSLRWAISRDLSHEFGQTNGASIDQYVYFQLLLRSGDFRSQILCEGCANTENSKTAAWTGDTSRSAFFNLRVFGTEWRFAYSTKREVNHLSIPWTSVRQDFARQEDMAAANSRWPWQVMFGYGMLIRLSEFGA